MSKLLEQLTLNPSIAPKQLAQWEICGGYGIHWESLDKERFGLGRSFLLDEKLNGNASINHATGGVTHRIPEFLVKGSRCRGRSQEVSIGLDESLVERLLDSAAGFQYPALAEVVPQFARS